MPEDINNTPLPLQPPVNPTPTSPGNSAQPQAPPVAPSNDTPKPVIKSPLPDPASSGMAATASVPTPAPVADQQQVNNTPKTAPVNSAEPTVASEEPKPKPITPPKQKKPKTDAVLISVALLVFVALSAVAIILYIQDDSNNEVNQASTTEQIQTVPVADEAFAEPVVNSGTDQSLQSTDEPEDPTNNSLGDTTSEL